MMQSDELIQSLVTLTRQRDKAFLEECLLSGMMDLLHAEELSLTHNIHTVDGYSVDKVSRVGNPQQHLITPREYCLECPQEVTSCIESDPASCLQSLDNGLIRLLLPVQTGEERYGVLSIVASKLSEEDRQTVVGMLRIFENIYTIIHDSETDTLTGLLNRKTFDKRIIQILTGEKNQQPETANTVTRLVNNERRESGAMGSCWIGVIDIDHFKRINDGYGHLYGDEVLLLLAQLMRKSFRDSDLLFRYGGEEFVVILVATSEENAIAVLERFRHTVSGHSFAQIDKVTISIGLSQAGLGDMVSDVFDRADKALYYAKENGRDQLGFYEQLVEAGKLEPEVAEAGDLELF